MFANLECLFYSATFALQLGEEMIDLMIDHVKENKCVSIYVRSQDKNKPEVHFVHEFKK